MKRHEEEPLNTDVLTSKERPAIYLQIISEFRKRIQQVSSHGPEKAREKHTNRGKLLARERIHLLLDEQTPFLELSAFALYSKMDTTGSFECSNQ